MSGDRPPCFCKTRLERPMRRSNGPITDTARLNVPPDASHGRHQTPASGAHRFQKCSFRRNHVRERSLCRPQQDQARKVAKCSLRDPGIPPPCKDVPKKHEAKNYARPFRTVSRLPVVFRSDIMLRPKTQAFGKSILPLPAPPGSRKDDRQKTSVEKLLSKFFSGAELLNAEGPRERRGP